MVAKAYEHVKMFSKCGAGQAREAMKGLLELGFSDMAASMLINILPESLEEAKAILADIDGGYPDEKIEKAVEILREACSTEATES